MGFGILGAGMISSLHADAFANSDKADLVAVCDISEERAQGLADKFAPNAKVYTDLKDMLADPAVEAVNVVTPNHLHKDAVVAIAEAGKHAMSEKPPAMSLADTDAMIKACDKAGVKFGIYVQCRMREPIQAMKKAIEAGRFGKILRADAVMKWYRAAEYYQMDAWRSQRKSGAGVTIQHAFHYIDLLQYLMGPAAEVHASMGNLMHQEVNLEDTLDARIRFENGAIGTVAASTGLWPGSDVRIEVYGENGAAVMRGATFELWKFKDELPEDEAIRNLGKEGQLVAGSDPTALESGEHQIVIDNLVDAVNEGADMVIPCTDVRPSLEMALAMYQSDKEGKAVQLPLQNESEIWD
jgi:predicted dehydrogenase